MFNRDSEQGHERETFVETWRRIEKNVERTGGLLLFLAAALVLAFDQPGDQLSALAAAAFVAAGLTFLVRSRRPAEKRARLYFLSHQQQSSRGIAAGLGAMFLLYQGMQTSRALFLIVAAVLGGVAAWYQWRAHKIAQYNTLFESPEDEAAGTDADENDEAA